MRLSVSLLLLAFSFLRCTGQQNNPEVQKLWADTKAAFLKKGEEGKRLAMLAMDWKSTNRETGSKVLAYSNRMISAAENFSELDSLHFHQLASSDDSLDAAIKVLRSQLDTAQIGELRSSYERLMLIYKGAESRVYVARSRFNEVAHKLKVPYYFTRGESALKKVEF